MSLALTPRMNGSPFASADNSLQDLSGWTTYESDFAYYSADAPSYKMSVSVLLADKLSPGYRVRVNQGGYKYFILTSVDEVGSTTHLTLYGGTDYTLADETITDVAFSPHKAPYGFPLDPDKWTVEITEQDWVEQASPVQDTRYDSGTSFSLPKGEWSLFYTVNGYAAKSSSYGDVIIAISSDATFATYETSVATFGYNAVTTSLSRADHISANSSTQFYVFFFTVNTSLTSIKMKILTIRAVSAYL
jgi:hypothetical protein